MKEIFRKAKRFVWVFSILSFLLITPSYAQNNNEFVNILPNASARPGSDDGVAVAANVAVGEISPISINQMMIDTAINDWRDSDWTGRSIRVGVLDLSFGGLGAFRTNIASVNIPPTAVIEDYDLNDDNHGTQVLEIIQSIAPGVELYACQYNNLVSFQSCVQYMVNSRVKIINHSAGLPVLNSTQSDTWIQTVEDVIIDNQILWVNAAGNFANGQIRGQITPDANGWHRFFGNGVIGSSMCVPANSENLRGRIMLTWEGNETYSANEIDLQLYIRPVSSCNENPARYEDRSVFSTQVQNGEDIETALDRVRVDMSEPFEILILSPIRLSDGASQAQGIDFKLLVDYGNLPLGESTIITPGESPIVITVGALQNNNIADYSSRGSQTIERIKPNIVAPGELELSNGSFIGTSAATPIVVGAAALIWEAFDDWTVDRLRAYILDEVALEDPSGNVFAYGNGRLNMPVPPGGGGEPIDVRIPYRVDFSNNGNETPIRQWAYSGRTSWQVLSNSGDGVLVGLSNLEEPIMVEGGATPEWTGTNNIVISFDFRLEGNAAGMRVVTQHDSLQGYHVVEFLPGAIYVKRDDQGNERDYVVDRDREQNLLFSPQPAPIELDKWYRTDIWLSDEYVYVYIDNVLYVRAQDQFQPVIEPGDIVFQAMDANRSVMIDNFSVLRAHSISNRFNSRSLPANWQTNNELETIFVEEGSNTFLQLRNDTVLSASMDPISDFLFSCDIRTSQGDFNLYMRESAEGALQFEWQNAILTVKRLDANDSVVWEDEIAPYFFSRAWDEFQVRMSGDVIEIARDGIVYHRSSIGGEGVLPAGRFRLESLNRGIVEIDDCLVIDYAQSFVSN